MRGQARDGAGAVFNQLPNADQCVERRRLAAGGDGNGKQLVVPALPLQSGTRNEVVAVQPVGRNRVHHVEADPELVVDDIEGDGRGGFGRQDAGAVVRIPIGVIGHFLRVGARSGGAAERIGIREGASIVDETGAGERAVLRVLVSAEVVLGLACSRAEAAPLRIGKRIDAIAELDRRHRIVVARNGHHVGDEATGSIIDELAVRVRGDDHFGIREAG